MNFHPPHFADSENGHTKIIKITQTPTPNHIKSYGEKLNITNICQKQSLEIGG